MIRIKADKDRPMYHFSPPYGWMNDPNGLIWHNGTYHMYYQWNPYTIDWDSMHWGHTTSTDLIHWKDEECVFRPEAQDTDYWSGSVVFDKDNTCGRFDEKGGLVAIYTHRDHCLQQQHIAFSYDGGMTFHPYENNPVIPNCGILDFRDPKVFWMEEDRQWHMIVAEYDSLVFYRSPDLISWERTGKFGEGYGLHVGSVWECPDMYPLKVRGTDEVKWLVHCGVSTASRTQCFIGEFDGKTFHCEDDPLDLRLFDYGYEDYSGVSFSNIPDGRSIFLGWLVGTWVLTTTPWKGFRGVFSIPREMELEKENGKYYLVQNPVKEIEKLYGERYQMSGCLTEGLQPMPIQGRSLDIKLKLRPGKMHHTHSAGILLSASNGGLKIGVDFDKKRLFADRSAGGRTVFEKDDYVYPVRIEAPLEFEEEVDLRILYDKTVVEIFACGGRVCISALYFPEKPTDRNLFFTEGGASVSAEIIRLNPVWE